MNALEIFDGSDGEATKALYERLGGLGPIGEIALNLFRAQKASVRAKVYRGGIRGRGSYRSMAYGRKTWSLSNLCTVLTSHAAAHGITYGWGLDEGTPGFEWVLYVEIPTGQVSFHGPSRGAGPDYTGAWDGQRGLSSIRITNWCQALIDGGAPSGQVHRVEGTSLAGELWCARCGVWWVNRRSCPGCRGALVAKPRLVPMPELRPGVRAEWDEPEEGRDGHA